MQDASPSLPRGRVVVIVLIVAAVVFGIGLGQRDLWNPNEPTYGRVVMEMVESGDWLLPQLNGSPFVEKPVLYYWLAGAASKMLGTVSATTLRLPVFLIGLLCVWLVFYLIEAYDGRRSAVIGCALFGTQYAVWFTARNVQMDSFVMLSTLGVVAALARRLDHDVSGSRSWLLAGAAAGIGLAGKGPVALVVPALVIAGYIVVGRRPWRRLFEGLPVGLLVFSVLALPWYAALYFGGHAEALYEVLLRQNVSRFVAAWDHDQPWWYYLKYFWATFAPWSWFVPIAALTTLRNRARVPNPGRLLAWIWILAPLIFFSLSDSKREPYMLPIAPAIAWLTARLFDRLERGELGRWQLRASATISGVLGGIFLLAGSYLLSPGAIDLPAFDAARGLAAAVLLICAAIVFSTLLRARTRRYAPAGVWLAMICLYTFIAVYLHAAVNPMKSHRPLMREVESRLPEGSDLYSLFGPRRLLRGGYAFYLGRSVPDLIDIERLEQVWSSATRPCVLYEGTQFRQQIEALAGAELVFEGKVGSTEVRMACAAAGVQPLPAGDSDRV